MAWKQYLVNEVFGSQVASVRESLWQELFIMAEVFLSWMKQQVLLITKRSWELLKRLDILKVKKQ